MRINQDDLPWWYVAIQGWLLMVKALRETHLPGWPERCNFVVDGGEYRGKRGPVAIYSLYSEYVAACDREARKARR